MCTSSASSMCPIPSYIINWMLPVSGCRNEGRCVMSMINLNHVSVVDYNLGGSLNPFSVWALATRTEPGTFSSGQP